MNQGNHQNCARCGIELQEDQLTLLDDKPYCEGCSDVLFGLIPVEDGPRPLPLESGGVEALAERIDPLPEDTHADEEADIDFTETSEAEIDIEDDIPDAPLVDGDETYDTTAMDAIDDLDLDSMVEDETGFSPQDNSITDAATVGLDTETATLTYEDLEEEDT